MSEPFDLFVVGRPSVDVMFAGMTAWPALGTDVEADRFGVCAGTTFNTPAVAHRVGLRVAYVATLGNDLWSRIIREEWEAEGIPTDFLEIEYEPLPAISVALNLDGDRGFVTHWGSDEEYDARLDARALELVTSVPARHLHSYVGESPELMAVARGRGMTISLDGWGDASWSLPQPLAEVLAPADVLLANEGEAKAMTGVADAQAALDALAEHCRCVVIKRGAAGAIGTDGGRRAVVPADPVELVDSTGAGDAFNAGFLAGWLAGLALEDSLTLGVICGSRAAGGWGGYRGVPREPEFRAIAATRGIALPSKEERPV